MTYDVVCADVLEWAAGYEGEPFHAMLCDPPYNYNFMGKDWDDAVAMQAGTWAALAEHLLPGAFVMAFGGARTYHRLACALEDAGLVIHSALGYLQGQGFPKATKIERTFANGSSPFCECESSQPLFPGHGLSENGHDEMDTTSSYPTDYSQDSRLGDEQPRQGQGIVQDALPLQDDVQGHNHSAEPSLETLVDSEPSHNPSEVQCSAYLRDCTCLDLLESSDDASQSRLGHADETYHGGDSNPASKDDNEGLDVSQGRTGDDKVADDSQRIQCSDTVSPYHTSSVESRAHNTTEQQFCQDCGKVRRGTWQGHRYGLQAIKPALEFIALAQKPYEGKPVENIVETGAGALNVDGGRIGVSKSDIQSVGGSTSGAKRNIFIGLNASNESIEYHSQGRWPANFILTHVAPDADGNGGCVRDGVRRVKGSSGKRGASTRIYGGGKGFTDATGEEVGYADADGREEVANWVCESECPIRKLGEQAGESVSSGGGMRNADKYSGGYAPPRVSNVGKGDKGSCARFYHQSDWSYEVAERLAAADAVRYQAKAAKREREAGLFGVIGCAECGDLETETHVNEHGRTVTCRRNDHSTVKPISLLIWLSRLLTPPGAYAPRRLLVPFSGSGSEMCAAILSGGFEQVVGIEQSQSYVDIANARLA